MSLIERLEKYCLTPAMAGFEEEMIKKNMERDPKWKPKNKVRLPHTTCLWHSAWQCRRTVFCGWDSFCLSFTRWSQSHQSQTSLRRLLFTNFSSVVISANGDSKRKLLFDGGSYTIKKIFSKWRVYGIYVFLKLVSSSPWSYQKK